MDQKEVDPYDVDHAAALLPPGKTDQADIVNPLLNRLDDISVIDETDLKRQKYKSKFISEEEVELV